MTADLLAPTPAADTPAPTSAPTPIDTTPAAGPSAVSTVDDAAAPSAGSEVRLAQKLNWIRAGVLGANDGIVSVAGLVMGVAGATSDRAAIAMAGVAGLVAGALSMAAGEYVSVSAQRDAEVAEVREAQALAARGGDGAVAAVAESYRKQGLSAQTALTVARELTAKDPVSAVVHAEHGFEPDGLTNAWQAAAASFVSFVAGALLPLAAILLAPTAAQVMVTIVAVVAALCLTGWGSARLGGADVTRSIVRNVLGGVLAMSITYGVGALLGQRV